MSQICHFVAAVEGVEVTFVNIAGTLVFLGGLAFFAIWLAKGGFKRLPPEQEQESLPGTISFGILLVWYGLMLVVGVVAGFLFKDEAENIKTAWTYIGIDLVNVVVIAGVLVLVKLHFSGGISEFGLSPANLGRNMRWAVVNYIAVLSLVGIGAQAVQEIGQMFWGEDFKLQTHESLKSLIENPDFTVRAILIASVVVIIPILEELVFRGLLQRSLVSYLGVWPGIIAASGIFAVLHGSWTHWVPIFILACGLGYAYQKSGSLWRPIFMHMLFNGVNTALMLSQNLTPL